MWLTGSVAVCNTATLDVRATVERESGALSVFFVLVAVAVAVAGCRGSSPLTRTLILSSHICHAPQQLTLNLASAPACSPARSPTQSAVNTRPFDAQSHCLRRDLFLSHSTLNHSSFYAIASAARSLALMSYIKINLFAALSIAPWQAELWAQSAAECAYPQFPLRRLRTLILTSLWLWLEHCLAFFD